MGQRVSLKETAKIKCHKKLQIIEENHRNQVIPVIFGGDYWTRTSGLMRVKIRWGRLLRDFGRIKRVCHRIPSPADMLCSTVSIPFFLLVGQDVGQNVMLS